VGEQVNPEEAARLMRGAINEFQRTGFGYDKDKAEQIFRQIVSGNFPV
jgi:hypothetical protein